jgi:hypothetical protein
MTITPIAPSPTLLGDAVLAHVFLSIGLNNFSVKWDKNKQAKYVVSRRQHGGHVGPYIYMHAERDDSVKPIKWAVEIHECKGSMNKFTVSFIKNPGQLDFYATHVTFTPYEIAAAARSILEYILLGTMLT